MRSALARLLAATIAATVTPCRSATRYNAWRIDISTIGESASAGPYISVAGTDPLTFTLAMEPTMESVTMAVDGNTVDPAERELVGETLIVSRQLDPGTHVATVAVVLADGTVYASADQITID